MRVARAETATSSCAGARSWPETAAHHLWARPVNDASLQLRFLAACAIAREAGQLVRPRFEQRDEVLKLAFMGPQDYPTGNRVIGCTPALHDALVSAMAVRGAFA